MDSKLEDIWHYHWAQISYIHAHTHLELYLAFIIARHGYVATIVVLSQQETTRPVHGVNVAFGHLFHLPRSLSAVGLFINGLPYP